MSEGQNYLFFFEGWPEGMHAGYFRIEEGSVGRVTYGFHGERDPATAFDPDILANMLTFTADWIRREGRRVTAYDLWRAVGMSNPRNKAAGSIGGTTAVANMTREQRRTRARKGGNQIFHGDTNGTDGVRASARGRLLARKRWEQHFSSAMT